MAEPEDINQYRTNHDTKNEWSMRRQFILAHWGKYPPSRLVSLANCHINVQCYGCRYPESVMMEIKELTLDFPKSSQNYHTRKQIKFVHSKEKAGAESAESTSHSMFDPPPPSTKVDQSPKPQATSKYGNLFVKSSDDHDTDTSRDTSKTTRTESTSIFDTPQPKVVKPSKLPAKPQKSGMSFVQASESYTSTDVGSSMRDPALALGDVSSTSRQSAAPHRQEDSEEVQKFYTLSNYVQNLSDKNTNAVGLIHMAADKLQMLVSPVIRNDSGSSQNTFICDLKIDFVEVACGKATTKKKAKREAFEIAKNLLLRPYLQLIVENPDSKKLNSSDVPFHLPAKSYFDSQEKEEGDLSEPDQTSERNMGMSVSSRKRPHAANCDLQYFTRFLIVEPKDKAHSNAVSILHQSVAFNKANLQMDYQENINSVRGLLTINGYTLVDMVGPSKPIVKQQTAERVLEMLRPACWTIQIKQTADTSQDGISRDSVIGELTSDIETGKISNSNVGHKLLMKMGWQGGGLGKEGNEGIVEPISAGNVINRAGLGLLSQEGISRNYVTQIKQMIHDYMKSDKEEDLAFAPDFTKKERAIIHMEARKLGLKTHSHGTGDNRYLVLGRRRTANQLFNHIAKHGGETSRYELIPPGENT